jgi:hypothetical protein
MALAFLGIQDFGRRGARQAYQLLLAAVCFVGVPVVIPGYAANLFPYRGDQGNVEIGLLLKANTPVDTSVADFWAGSVFYFSERHGIDMIGKADRYIAHLPVVSDGMMPGHNKFDFDYSLGALRPDLVVANFQLPVDEHDMREAATGDWAFTGQLYFHPLFQQHCLPNPVPLDTWRTVFVCDWSSRINSEQSWNGLIPGG